MYVWVINPEGKIDFKPIPLEEGLSSQVRLTRKVAASYIDRGDTDTGYLVWARELRANGINDSTQELIIDEDRQRAELKKLYQVLIAPIETFLPEPNSDTHLVFIPQGNLFQVPFAALQDELGQYLINNYAIRIAPSLRVLKQSSKTFDPLPEGDEVLIVGNPLMPAFEFEGEESQPLPQLEGAQTEAQGLGDLFNTVPLIKNFASEALVRRKMSSARIIHLATHGILDNQNLGLTAADLGQIIEQEFGTPARRTAEYLSKLADDLLPGAIVLAQSKDEDGLLTSSEILGLDLDDAELVVLSACNTARGITSESTVLGLPYALGAAGASRVVVSLWSVPDKPTQALMQAFYMDMQSQAAASEDVDPAQALRHAMSEIQQQEEFKDPVNWAGFNLIEVTQNPVEDTQDN